MLRPQDIVGCHYRLHQRESYPHLQPTPYSLARAQRLEDIREEVTGNIRHSFNAHKDEYLSKEAIKESIPLISNILFRDEKYEVEVDFLLKVHNGWMPIMVTGHKVARPHKTATTLVHKVADLGKEFYAHYKVKHRSIDSFRLAMAAYFLKKMNLDSGRGGLIGQNPHLCFEFDTTRFSLPEDTQPSHAPRRMRECAHCRYWKYCEEELIKNDDLSLVFPGGKGDILREHGLTTVEDVIHANLPIYSPIAQAWRKKIPVLYRKDAPTIPTWDVEIDIDMEAYLDYGAYLWGCWDGRTYTPFATWTEELGGKEEAQNFSLFWQWLINKKDTALKEGKSFAAFCYAANGENHWLRQSALRFAGYPGIPSIKEVEEFINSPHWIDVFQLVRTSLIGVDGLGLKIIAPLAGFHWDEEDLDGEKSLEAYRRKEKERILSYNNDDCKATAIVRQWLRAGAPGISEHGRF